MTPSLVNLTRRDLYLKDLQRGYSDIGYHYVIERDGKLSEGRGLEYASIHDDFKYATKAVSVCLVGGLGESGEPLVNFTDAQWDSLLKLALDKTIEKVVPVASGLTDSILRQNLGFTTLSERVPTPSAMQ